MSLVTKPADSWRSNEKVLIGLVFGLAFLARVLLQLTPLPELLMNRVEVSTPVTSFKNLKEGVYLFKHGIDPYDGGICHQAPILLAILDFLQSLPSSATVEVIVYSVIDLFSAWTILEISSSAYVSSRTTEENKMKPFILSAIALLNPFAIMLTVARSSAIFNSLAILLSMSNALSGQVGASVFFLALASYMSVYPVLMIAPLILLLADVKQRSVFTTMLHTISIFLLSLGFMFYASYLWLGSFNFIPTTYSIIFLMTELTPNIGLWWYLFTEMFEDFRSFFLVVFQLHLLIYVIPLCIKLRTDPFFVLVTLCGLLAIFKPYPSIADSNLYLILLPLFPLLAAHMRYLFLVSCALLYCCILGPTFYYLWIYAGSGNANFFYAITLVWNLAQGILLTDTVYAFLKLEWENEEPELRLGKNLETSQTAD